MKKLLLLIPFIFYSLLIVAQTQNIRFEKPADFASSQMLEPLVVAPDFSVTFTDGTPANLYATCTAGNSVVLDFFYTTCGYCISYAPIIDQAYVAHGSGAGNIKFWGIDDGDTDAEVIAYKSANGVTNPCASGTQGGGNAATDIFETGFAWSGWPTYSVVCPDKTYSHDVNYPPSATGFNSYFTTCGTTSIDENGAPTQTTITMMYPLPAKENVNVHIYVDASSQIKLELFDLLGNVVYTDQSSAGNGYFNASVPVSNLAEGVYIIKLHQNDQVKDVQKIMVVK